MQNLFDISGKVALVTGGSRGIGYMIAQGFVEAGAKVYISARKADACDAAAAELSKVGQCVSIPGDISTEAGARALAEAIGAREDRLHILVNNAGANWGAPMAEFPDAAFDKVMNTNVKGVFHLTRFLVPQLEKAGSDADPARVINIGSIDGLTAPTLDTYAYSASKAAVHHMTRVLAHQLAPKHITVNAIAPGPFVTNIGGGWAKKDPDVRKAFDATIPLGSMAETHQMKPLALLLASDAGSFITGSTMLIDGGVALGNVQ